jgi:hypothetical protein
MDRPIKLARVVRDYLYTAYKQRTFAGRVLRSFLGFTMPVLLLNLIVGDILFTGGISGWVLLAIFFGTLIHAAAMHMLSRFDRRL